MAAWCRKCGDPVIVPPAPALPGPTPWARGEGVHAAGPAGHLAVPTRVSPALQREADAVEAEFRVSVSAMFGFFRADRIDVADPVHWEADDAESLRRQLPAWLRRTAPSGQGARS